MAMKTNTISSFFILFAIVATLSTIPSAFAAEVSVPDGSGVPGCEETSECWIPNNISIAVGDTVTWSNDDIAAHTVTSGSPADGPDGIFDSSLFMAGATFEHTFDAEGTFDYFCMVHPWMQGMVTVGAAMAEEPMMGEETVMITINAEPAGAGQSMVVNVSITDSDGNAVDHVNFDVKATQGDKLVLDELNVHDHDGVMSFDTSALESDTSGDNPVDIEVTFQGYGLPDDPKTGPIGEEVYTQVVPEFGTIAMMILAVGVVSIIAFTAKTKLIPRL